LVVSEHTLLVQCTVYTYSEFCTKGNTNLPSFKHTPSDLHR